MIAFYLAKYWKLAVLALLLGAVGIQTYRLRGSQADLAASEAREALFEADMALKRAEGVAEGRRLEAEAQAEVARKAAQVAAQAVVSAEKRAKEAQARAARLAELLKEAKWSCLWEPLDEDTLNEFRQ